MDEQPSEAIIDSLRNASRIGHSLIGLQLSPFRSLSLRSSRPTCPLLLHPHRRRNQCCGHQCPHREEHEIHAVVGAVAEAEHLLREFLPQIRGLEVAVSH